MQIIQLEIKDDYSEKILNFLKLLPENVAKIKIYNSSEDREFENELYSRVQEIENNQIKAISRDELFNDL